MHTNNQLESGAPPQKVTSTGQLTGSQSMMTAKRWLLWKHEKNPGEPKPKKKPFYVNGSPRGTSDTDNDHAQLASYFEARDALKKKGDEWGWAALLAGFTQPCRCASANTAWYPVLVGLKLLQVPLASFGSYFLEV
jgi:hypothetical protein